jgi:hypothetical protein
MFDARKLISRTVLGALAAFSLFALAAVPALAAAPVIEEQSVSEITATSGRFNAQVNPGGLTTSYEFEYAPAGGTFKPVPEAEGHGGVQGEAGVPLTVNVQQGFTPGASYEFRVVASNSEQTVTGEAVTFTMQASGAFTLPDGREWEQASPPDKHGANFYRLNGGGQAVQPQVSVAGSAIAMGESLPSEADPEGYADFTSVLLARGPGGWRSQTLAPAHHEAVGPNPGGEGSEYRMFSSDLSKAIVQARGTLLLSPQASEQTAYLRTLYSNGNVGDLCEGSFLTESSCYQPLVTRAEDTADPFQPFGETNPQGRCGNPFKLQSDEFPYCGPFFVDATPDLSHVVLSSRVQLTSTPTQTFNGVSLYEWGEGQLQPLFLLPADEGGTGIAEIFNEEGFDETEEFAEKSNQLSTNGSLFFSYNGHLYLHDFAKDASVRLDRVVSGPGLSEPTGGAEFVYASTDGSKVLFEDPEQLTSTAGGGVYECVIAEVAGLPSCGTLTLTNLSFTGKMLGGSEDASYLYFGGKGSHPLYVDHYTGSEWTQTELPFLSQNQYRISPNGRWFAFMSSNDLTGYDSHDALSGQPDKEVYLYNAETGKLACASCDPTGARPVGTEEGVGAGLDLGEHVWVAAGIPRCGTAGEAALKASGIAEFFSSCPTVLSDSGRLFFDSYDSLVPEDVNGTWDAYEYEPEGVPAGEHACAPASAGGSHVFEPARSVTVEGVSVQQGAGCVALISSGTSPEESSFLGASPSGGDVYFVTDAKLSPADTDTSADVYDAHECTTSSPCIAPPSAEPPACTTEASCRPAPTPQPSIYGLPSSATFSGSGNPPPPPVVSSKVVKKTTKCKKPERLSGGKCVKPKKRSRRRKAKNAIRAGNNDRRMSR